MRKPVKAWMVLFATTVLATGSVGCNLSEDVLDEIEDIIKALGGVIDLDDLQIGIIAPPPRYVAATGNTVIIDQSVTIINNPRTDIIIEDIPDIVLIGFENFTGWDIFVRYEVDGELQGVFVLDGEVLLLEYPCVFTIELLSEDDIDPFTGELVDEFILRTFVEEGFDYYCGEAVIFSFFPDAVETSFDSIRLLD